MNRPKVNRRNETPSRATSVKTTADPSQRGDVLGIDEFEDQFINVKRDFSVIPPYQPTPTTTASKSPMNRQQKNPSSQSTKGTGACGQKGTNAIAINPASKTETRNCSWPTPEMLQYRRGLIEQADSLLRRAASVLFELQELPVLNQHINELGEGCDCWHLALKGESSTERDFWHELYKFHEMIRTAYGLKRPTPFGDAANVGFGDGVDWEI